MQKVQAQITSDVMNSVNVYSNFVANMNAQGFQVMLNNFKLIYTVP